MTQRIATAALVGLFLWCTTPAAGAATIGSTVGGGGGCSGGFTFAEPQYSVPAGGGTITSFLYRSLHSAGQQVDFKVFRPDALDPHVVTVVGSTGARTLVTDDQVETIAPAEPIPVQEGDFIGFYVPVSLSGCAQAGGVLMFRFTGSDPPTGSTLTLAGPFSGVRLVLAAEVLPPDATPPTVQCGGADGEWHATNVSIPCSASDDGSGLADPGDASFELSTSVPSGVEDADAATDSREVCDQASNCATAGPVAGNRVDRRAPTVTLTSPADGDSYLIDSAHAAAYGCTDLGSLVATCDGADIDTSSIGTKTFTVQATDNVGNAAPAQSATYRVTWPFSGFYAPVGNRDAGGEPVLNRANAGSAIPVKFGLGGDRGPDVMAAGSPASGTIACSGTATSEPVEQTVTAGSSGLSYDADTGTYTYVWKTDKAWAGTCRGLAVELADGTVHRASFDFRR